jgi:hypothetical protein
LRILADICNCPLTRPFGQTVKLAVRQSWLRIIVLALIQLSQLRAAHFRNRIYHVLSGQGGFLADQVIARVMDVVFAMQLLLKSKVGKSVAGAVELFHGGLEFLLRLRADNQFGLYRKVNAHSFKTLRRYARRVNRVLIEGPSLSIRIRSRFPLHPNRSGCGYSIHQGRR